MPRKSTNCSRPPRFSGGLGTRLCVPQECAPGRRRRGAGRLLDHVLWNVTFACSDRGRRTELSSARRSGANKVHTGKTTLVSKLPLLLLGPARRAPDSSKSALSHPTIHTVSVTLGCSASSRAYTKNDQLSREDSQDCAACMSLRDLLSLASTPSSYDTAEQSDHNYAG